VISFEDRIPVPSRPTAQADDPPREPAGFLGADLDLTETLRATATALRGVTGADRAVVYLHDPARDTLRRIVATADDRTGDEQVRLRGRSPGDIPLLYAVRGCPGGTLELPDAVGVRALTPARARQIQTRATLGVALRHPSVVWTDDAPLGIAFCEWRQPRPAFPAATVRAARAIAAQAAVALANAHNHSQGEDLVRRLSLLAAWAARLAAAGSPERVTSRAARAAALLLDSPVVAHWSPAGAAWYPVAPDAGGDHEAALAALASHGARFREITGGELPDELAAALDEQGLDHAAVCVAQDRASMLFLARELPPNALDAQIGSLLADLTGSALRTAEAHARVAHLALTDPLTDVGNRRAFETRAAEVLALSMRTGRPTSLCLIDVDHFRAFNEAGGHQVGDAALRLVADALRAQMRTSDQAFRIGGDEFALVLAETPASSAVTLLQRVLETLRTTHLGEVSITAGIAEAPAQGHDVAALSAAADGALYAGKRAGRGKIMLAGGDPPPA
jgi:diguanylate cyclase (GGDEF)-like protein